YEKGIANVMAGMSGLNLVYEAAGMHASLRGFCLESLIADNDMLGQCLRCVRGIETDNAALSVDAIAETCLAGPGHYLHHPHTGQSRQAEYFYPALADRSAPAQWAESGKPDLLRKAVAEKRRVLESAFPRHVPKAVDDRLRQRFANIRLPREAMGT